MYSVENKTRRKYLEVVRQKEAQHREEVENAYKAGLADGRREAEALWRIEKAS